MNTISYAIEVNLALSIVAIFYYLVLKNETNFQFQRIFILFGVFASVIFPLIHIETEANIPTASGIVSYTLPELTITEHNKAFEFTSLLITIYFIISSLFLIRLIWAFLKLFNLSHRYKKSNPPHQGSFSFWKFIFIEHSFSSEDKEMILKHEQVHARLFHSADIVLLEFLKVAFWFNPVIYFLRKEISNIHEFQADEIAIKELDAEKYCNLLARVALQSADFPIANHFNNSFTLTRIIMITKEKVKISRWKILASVTLAVGLFVFVSCGKQDLKKEDQAGSPINDDNKVFTFVEESAVPTDGIASMYKALSNTMRYPPTAREKGTEGKVIVEFIVNKDGSTSDYKVVRGIGEGCDEEAIRALQAINLKWNPGTQSGAAVRQKMVIPIVFKINGSTSEAKKESVVETPIDPSTAKKLNELVVVSYRP